MGQIVAIAGSTAFRVGLQLATVAASVALQIALRPKPPNVEGPRIGELGVSASTYGTPVTAHGYGRFRLGTNMIWATDIVEVAQKRKQGGGKGGGSSSITTYQYFGNAAFAVGIGPAGTIRRIWADSKIIYDVTGTTGRVFKYDAESALRIYPGEELQDPDELIESVEGVGNVPGYRGLVYFVLENLPLEDFGNRIPQLQVEVEYETVSVPAEVAITDTTNRNAASVGLFESLQQLIALEFPGGHIHRISLITNAREERIAAVSTALYDGFPNLDGGLEARSVHTGPDDRVFLFGKERSGSQNIKFVHINPYTLTPISVGTTPLASFTPSTRSRGCHYTFTQPSTVGLRNWTACFLDGTDSFASFGQSYLMLWDRDGETSSGAASVSSTFPIGKSSGGRVTLSAMTLDNNSDLWAIGLDRSIPVDAAGRRCRLYKIKVEVHAIDPGERQILDSTFSLIGGTGLGDLYGQVFQLLFGQPTASIDVVKEFDLTQYGLHATQPNPEDTEIGSGIVYNPILNELVLFGDPDDNGDYTWVRWDPVTETAVQTRTLNDTDDADLVVMWRDPASYVKDSVRQGPREGRVYLYNNSGPNVFYVNLADLTDVDITDQTLTVSVSSFFHEHRRHSIIYWTNTGSGESAERQFLGASDASAPTLQAVVEGICGEVGLDPSDLGFDAGFTGKTVVGYAFGAQRNARSVLDPLLFAFTFDGVESDFLLKFVTRGTPTPVAVPEEDLQARVGLPLPGDDLVLEVRNQEVEVPEQVTIRYIEEERDFQEATQSVRRHRTPNPTQYSEGPLTVELPVVLPGATVRNAANARLYNAWIERVQFELALGPSYLRLDPTDLLEVAKGDVTLTMRLGQADLGGGLVQKLQGLADDVDSYTQSAPPATTTINGQSVEQPGPTELILLDTPFMRDVDSTHDLATGIYAAFGAHTDAWRGAALLISKDAGASFESLGAAKGGSAWGYLDAEVAALPLEPSGARTDRNDGRFSNLITAWDRTTSVDVYIVDGAELLASTTEALVLNGANTAAIVKRTGKAEIFQFANVTDLGGNIYRFDTLLRGRRGTELQAVAGHTAGERFVLLRSVDTSFFALPLEDLTKEFIWRAQSLGEPSPNVAGQVVPLRGENLKPLTPVNPEVDLDIGSARSGQPIVVTWTRRTRFGGNNDFVDGVQQVPLGESTESYEVGLLDQATASTIVSTYPATDDATGVSIPSADRVTAGYADTDAVNLVIYQVNAIIGRGQLLQVLI